MAKIGLADITPNAVKIEGLSPASANTGFFSPSGIKQFKDIIDSIRAMVKEAKELQNPNSLPSDAVDKHFTPPSGITKEQIYGIGRSFLDNLIKQGYGEKTIVQTLGDIPLTIKQIRGLLQ